jgi:hypothetical protein
VYLYKENLILLIIEYVHIKNMKYILKCPLRMKNFSSIDRMNVLICLIYDFDECTHSSLHLPFGLLCNCTFFVTIYKFYLHGYKEMLHLSSKL